MREECDLTAKQQHIHWTVALAAASIINACGPVAANSIDERSHCAWQLRIILKTRACFSLSALACKHCTSHMLVAGSE